MNALVTVIWQELPESTQIFSVATKDQAEYDLLMSFHDKYINESGLSKSEENKISEYFFNEDGTLKFLDEYSGGPLEMLGIEGVKFAVICTGIYL